MPTTSNEPASAPPRAIFSNDAPPPSLPRHTASTLAAPALSGVVSLVLPAITDLMAFPPTYGQHGTSLGAPGFAVLASGGVPGIAALVLGVRVLRAKKAGSRVLPIFGMGSGLIGIENDPLAISVVKLPETVALVVPMPSAEVMTTIMDDIRR